MELTKMKKEELIAFAEENDMKFNSSSTKKELIETIEKHLSDTNTKTEESQSGNEMTLKSHNQINKNKFRRKKKERILRKDGKITIDSKDKYTNTISLDDVSSNEIYASYSAYKNPKAKVVSQLFLLTGTVTGVVSQKDRVAAIVQYNQWKVYISEENFFPNYATLKENPNCNFYRYIENRFGSEIDFIITSIENDEPGSIIKTAIGNRVLAMKAKTNKFWESQGVGKNRKVEKYLKNGDKTQARVVSIVQTGVWVEIFGQETEIPLQELSYKTLLSPTDLILNDGSHLAVGKKIDVVLMNIKYYEDRVFYHASVKRTQPDPRPALYDCVTVGESQIGTVTYAMTGSRNNSLNDGLRFFVSIMETSKASVTVLCILNLGMQRIPQVGDRVKIRITKKGFDEVKDRHWLTGTITHII